VFNGSLAVPRVMSYTYVERGGGSTENSVFGNLTAHLGNSTELSGGVRHISYKSTGSLALYCTDPTFTARIVSAAAGCPGVVPQATENRTVKATIWSASAKHSFSRDLMVYVNLGSSWRPGSATNPINVRSQSNPTGTLASFLYPPAEKSTSYEIGFKSEWLDHKLRLNVDFFHQKFSNFGYAASTIYYLTDLGVSTSPASTIAAPVKAKVDGVEAEIGLKPMRNWSIDATLAYSKSKVISGAVPCNPSAAALASTAAFLAATGGEQIKTCSVSNIEAGTGAPFTATVQSEYTMPLTGNVDGYLRGMMTYYSKSKNDPFNAGDDVPAYALVNLYAGARAATSGWEVGVYVKNLFDVSRVLNRNASLISAPRGSGAVSTYRTGSSSNGLFYLAPREVGLTARLAFGSR